MKSIFVGLICTWMVSIVAAPLLSRRPSLASALFVDAVYTCGRVVCHQRPERSFELAGTPMPVCARCTGLYGGAAAAAIVLVFRRRRMPLTTVPAARIRLVYAAAAVPILSTLFLEWTTGDVPSGVVRALSAAPFGAAVAWTLVRTTPERRPVGVN